MSLIGDTIEDIEEKIMYKESFRSLFVNDQSPIYKDILPDNKKSPYIPVSDYINLYSDAYASTGGIVAFQLDSTDLGFIVRDMEKDYRFTCIVQVNKSFKGNYLGKRKISFQIRLALKITFDYANTVFKNFRIVCIDLNMPKKTEVNEPLTFTDLQKHKAAPKKAEPAAPKTAKETQPPAEALKIHLMLDAGAMMGMGRIGDGNIDQLTMGNASHVWQTKPNLSYTAFLQYTYMVSQRLGLSLGIGYSSISTKFSLNSTSYADSIFSDTRNDNDINGEKFYRQLKADYYSTVSIKFINIPISVLYNFNISKKLKAFIKPGVNIRLVRKATSVTNGYIKNTGYYPSHKRLLFQNIYWPELTGFGFFDDTVKNKTYDIKPLLSSIVFSLNTSAGVSLDLSRHTSLALSGYFQYKLNDLVKNQSDYKDVFARTATDPLTIQNHVFKHQPTKIFIYGMAIEFILKF